MKITLYPKYLIRSLFVHGRHDFFKDGYKLLYPEYSRHGMTPWQHYVMDGKRKGFGNGTEPPATKFFREGYETEYPDVKAAGVDPWRHFAEKGLSEGRDNGLNPDGKAFFKEGYLAMYPDVAKSGMDPWHHYVLKGKQEGRDNGLHPDEKTFSAEGYLKMYPDVAKRGLDPWHHYVLVGKKEGRENGRSDVDPEFYLSVYTDVKNRGIDPVYHYINFGKKEGRFPNCKALESNNEDLQLIKKSEYFDGAWYLHEYSDSYQDPAVDYFIKFKSRNPSVNFITKDYLRIHDDVRRAGMNPLVHFERFGKIQNRPMILTFDQKEIFPDDLKEIEGINCKIPQAFNNNHPLHKKVMVFAAYCKDGRLHEFRKNLIHELRQYCDYLVFVSDNPMLEDEVRNFQDIDAFICRKHGRFDFGSYIYGIEHLSRLGFLDGINDLVLCNDSGLGPVCSFSSVFKKYDSNKSRIDFYGLSVADTYKKYRFIQSFFFIFSPELYQSEVFKRMFDICNIPVGMYFDDMAQKMEGELTNAFVQAGFTYSTFVDDEDFVKRFGNVRPTDRPLSLIKVYGFPLVKRKYLVLNNGRPECEELVDYLKKEKKDFWNSIESFISEEQSRAGSIVTKDIYRPIDYSFAAVRRHYSELVPKIRRRIRTRGFIKVDFLVANLSMLAYRSLIDKMMQDSRFRVRVIVIPDTRWKKIDTLKEYRKCLKELTSAYGRDIVSAAVINPESRYPGFNNIFEDQPDVVFYPTPYDLSYTPYNIPNAIRYNVLPAYINYGFPRNKYCEWVFRTTNYCNLWKVFLETDFQLNDYRKNGYVHGYNAVVAGYSKIDELYDITQKLDYAESHTYNGKVYDRVVILAPHHSLEGGYNATMHLSNFLKYADFFQKLPGKFKNILFVFRPHPALFFLLKQDRFWGEKKVEDYLKKIQENDNLILSTEGDYFHWFAASDAMIHDCGSFTVEYLYTDKPCCYMLKSENEIDELFNDFGKQCLECYYHALSEDDIVKFIQEEVLQGQDSKKSIRTKFAHEVLMKDYPHSSEKIMNYLEETLMSEKRRQKKITEKTN